MLICCSTLKTTTDMGVDDGPGLASGQMMEEEVSGASLNAGTMDEDALVGPAEPADDDDTPADPFDMAAVAQALAAVVRETTKENLDALVRAANCDIGALLQLATNGQANQQASNIILAGLIDRVYRFFETSWDDTFRTQAQTSQVMNTLSAHTTEPAALFPLLPAPAPTPDTNLAGNNPPAVTNIDELNARLDAMTAGFNARLDAMGAGFNNMAAGLNTINTRLDTITVRQNALEARVESQQEAVDMVLRHRRAHNNNNNNSSSSGTTTADGDDDDEDDVMDAVLARLERLGELRQEAERASIRRTEEEREERVDELDESLEAVDKETKATRKMVDDLVRQFRRMCTWQIARNEGDLTVEEWNDRLWELELY
ncbi:hypothetical protein C8A01DRAFT_40808 [Parachaetomium inaequale]|uniref:Uncharacterized protein n=1 Tax=Parachaetomium inaequale TaxID=2588326 RepID=A0AAN6SMN3_9PEZI|nr:hypothetical protein C8A01DRAFT_40808 [Parachaetomium inaequale]